MSLPQVELTSSIKIYIRKHGDFHDENTPIKSCTNTDKMKN